MAVTLGGPATLPAGTCPRCLTARRLRTQCPAAFSWNNAHCWTPVLARALRSIFRLIASRTGPRACPGSQDRWGDRGWRRWGNSTTKPHACPRTLALSPSSGPACQGLPVPAWVNSSFALLLNSLWGTRHRRASGHRPRCPLPNGRQAPPGASQTLIIPQAPARHKYSLDIQEKHAAGMGSLSQC